MQITAKMVAELRERTGVGMMDCKKALVKTDGDIEKAIEILREKGLAAAAKKAGRIASEGLISAYITDDQKLGAVIEFNCETDFVAKNDEFIAMSDNLAKQAALSKAENIDELLLEKYIANEEITVKDAITALIAKLGENMNLRRFKRISAKDGIVASYIHGGGRIGVIVNVESDKDAVLAEVAKEMTLQVAAANPLYLNKEDVSVDALEKEKEIYKQQALNEGKPEKVIEKMIIGRIQKYYKEVCLMEELYIRDQDINVRKFIEQKSKENGSEIKVVKFARFEKGEGIEKKEEDFAEEVKKQMKG